MFQIDAAETANAQRPKVTVRVHGTIRSPRSDEWCFAVVPGWMMSENMSCMFTGASSCNALYFITPILNCIRCSIRSQCRSSQRIGVTCSRLETPSNSLAVRFGETVVDGCRVPEDQRVTSYSNLTSKLRMHTATDVEQQAIVIDEQHVVDDVENSMHDTYWMCCFGSRWS